MRPEDVREFNRRQPFEPYRIHITGGQTYDIKHPDQIIVQQSRVGVGDDRGFTERIEHIALIHIVRIEEIQQAMA